MPSQFEAEIREQPVTLARLLETAQSDVAAIAERVRAFAPEFVMIAARGTSDNAARYAQYLFGAHNGLPVGLATPSLFTLYRSPPRLPRALVIGISQSGQSPDIVSVIREARSQGALTLAVTNDQASDLAEAAELCLELYAGEERAVAASKTYTSQLAALAMVSVALTVDRQQRDELATLPEIIRRTLDLNRDIAPRVTGLVGEEQFVVIGRGFNYATAFELALKIKETSYVSAEAHSSAEFLHGPVAVIDNGFPAILVAPTGQVFSDVAALADLLAARNATLITVSDNPDLLSRADVSLPLPAGVPEWISPIVAIVPGQLLALALAHAKGIDPDYPRGLSKVTRTR